MVATPLFNPDEFFRKRPEPSLGPPVVIFAVVAFATLIVHDGVLYGFWNTVTSLDFYLGLLSGMLGLGMYWIGTTVFFYLLSLLFGGQGAFRRLFAYFGWAMLPQLLVIAVGLLAIGLFPEEVIRTGGDRLVTLSGSLLRTSQVIAVLGILWEAYIWVYALMHGRNLARRHALILVSVTVIVPLIGIIILGYLFFPDLVLASI